MRFNITMPKILYWILGIVVLLGIAVLLFVQFSSPAPSEPIPGGSTTPTPGGSITPGTGSGSPSTITIGIQNGSLVVKDFVHDPETVPEVGNLGTYYLAGYCLQEETCTIETTDNDFLIIYDTPDSFFNIVILAEPIAEERNRAESLLMERLGISEADI